MEMKKCTVVFGMVLLCRNSVEMGDLSQMTREGQRRGEEQRGREEGFLEHTAHFWEAKQKAEGKGRGRQAGEREAEERTRGGRGEERRGEFILVLSRILFA